jgi:hypothetical protein
MYANDHSFCDSEDMKATGSTHIGAVRTEKVKGSGQMSVSSGGRTFNCNTGFSATWVSASCAAAE